MMQDQCIICRLPFDQFEHLPIILCPNRHMCCEECENNMRKKNPMRCHSCRVEIKGKTMKCRSYLDWLRESKDNRAKLKKEKDKTANMSQVNDALQVMMQFLFPNADKFYKYAKEKAECLILAGKNYAAIALLEALIKKFPNNQDFTFIGLGSREEKMGFSQGKPLTWYKEYYGVNDLSAEDLLNFTLMETPQYEGSLQWYSQMINFYPLNYRLLYGSALNKHNRSFRQSALEDYRKVIELIDGLKAFKLNPEFYKAYCMAAYLVNSYKEALKLAEISKNNDPQNIFAKFFLASVIQKSNDKLWEISQEEPLFVRALYEIGNNYCEQGQQELAILTYQQCIQKNPLFFQPKIGLSNAYIRSGNQAKAKEYLIKLLQERLTSEQRSWVLLKMSKVENNLLLSMIHLKQSIELDPQDSSAAMIHLALSYQKMQRLQFALQLYQKVYAKKELIMIALQGISTCYIKMKNHLQAVQYLKQWARLDPQNSKIQLRLGDAYFTLKDWQRSLECYLQYISDCPHAKVIQVRIIMIYYKLGDYKTAIRFVGQHLQNDLTVEQYDEALKMGEELRRALFRTTK